MFFWAGRAEEAFPKREMFYLSLKVEISFARRMGGKAWQAEGTARAKTLRSGHGSGLLESARIQREGESGAPPPSRLSSTMTNACAGTGHC